MKVYDTPRSGDVWRDRDKRMLSGNRRVVVSHIAPAPNDVGAMVPTWVFYQAARRDGLGFGSVLRSRLDRFQRRFELVERVKA